jgi:HNH/ENDO VII superfamily nuclease with conserved GHE residues
MTDNTTKGRIYTMTSPPPKEDAAPEQQDSVPATGKNPLEQGKNESAGVIEKKWDDLKKGLGTIKEALGLGVSPEMASAAQDRVKEAAKDMAKDAIFRVGGGGGPEERAAKAREQVDAQIDQMRQAYSRNGLAGMVGAMATNMAMDKVAGKVIGAAKTGVGKTGMGKTGDAPHDSKPPISTTQKESSGGNDGVVIKLKSLREQYLGRTPGKGSKTGKEVQERMRKDGKLRDGDDGPEFQASNDKWYPLKDADMAHHPKDAVSWWNETGRQYGPKSEEVRNWMKDSNNYTLDHYSLNRSAGAKLTERYSPPLNP